MITTRACLLLGDKRRWFLVSAEGWDDGEPEVGLAPGFVGVRVLEDGREVPASEVAPERFGQALLKAMREEVANGY